MKSPLRPCFERCAGIDRDVQESLSTWRKEDLSRAWSGYRSRFTREIVTLEEGGSSTSLETPEVGVTIQFEESKKPGEPTKSTSRWDTTVVSSQGSVSWREKRGERGWVIHSWYWWQYHGCSYLQIQLYERRPNRSIQETRRTHEVDFEVRPNGGIEPEFRIMKRKKRRKGVSYT